MRTFRGDSNKYLFAENVKPNHIRYIVRVTIESAENFEDASNLYVQHLLDLPTRDWDVTGADQSIQGFTHQSHIINSKSHFGHSFTLDISKPYRADSEEIPLSSPLLLFEVYNVGFWNRQSSVGYGFTRLRLDPGSHVEMVPTWRPMRDSPGEKLEEFFLGLAPEIENLSYAGIPNDDGLFARFPFTTASSGMVRVRFDTMIQRGRDVLEHEWASSSSNQQHQTSANCAVNDVIQAYHRAKQRLKAAHDALLR